MTTASTGVAVIATQLARTDRRALSEAWYSALHLAHGAAPVRARSAHGVPASSAPAPAARNAAAPSLRRVTHAPSQPHTQHGASARVGPANERRRPVTEAARRIERAVAALAAQAKVPGAHTVDVAGGRVRLLVHGDGRTTRIVALCSGPLREQVERALASARFALAGAGLAVGAP